jgi:hypothetical protein
MEQIKAINDELMLPPAPHGAMELAKVGRAAVAGEAQLGIDYHRTAWNGLQGLDQYRQARRPVIAVTAVQKNLATVLDDLQAVAAWVRAARRRALARFWSWSGCREGRREAERCGLSFNPGPCQALSESLFHSKSSGVITGTDHNGSELRFAMVKTIGETRIVAKAEHVFHHIFEIFLFRYIRHTQD